MNVDKFTNALVGVTEVISLSGADKNEKGVDMEVLEKLFRVILKVLIVPIMLISIIYFSFQDLSNKLNRERE